MTSYRIENGRMRPDHLPPDFGEQLAIRQHPDLQAWASKQIGKRQWGPRCRVAILTENLAEHTRTIHPRMPRD